MSKIIIEEQPYPHPWIVRYHHEGKYVSGGAILAYAFTEHLAKLIKQAIEIDDKLQEALNEPYKFPFDKTFYIKENFYKKVIDTFGVEKQLDMVVEECAELIQAINKVKRKGLLPIIGLINKNTLFENKEDALTYNNLCSEVADVEIMLEQLRLMLNEEQINLIKERKLERLKQRIK